MASEIKCLEAILPLAEPMKVDELMPDFKTTCLSIPSLSEQDLIMAYVLWLDEHPDVDAKPASITISAALLEKVPCGWTEK